MKEIYQVKDGYVIPSEGIEVNRFNGRYVVRFDIKPYVREKNEEEETMMAHYNNEPPQMTCERIELETIDYPTLVSSIVRCKYSQSDIEAIVLNGSDTEEHLSEYNTLQEWRNHAKDVAKKVLDILV